MPLKPNLSLRASASASCCVVYVCTRSMNSFGVFFHLLVSRSSSALRIWNCICRNILWDILCSGCVAMQNYLPGVSDPFVAAHPRCIRVRQIIFHTGPLMFHLSKELEGLGYPLKLHHYLQQLVDHVANPHAVIGAPELVPISNVSTAWKAPDPFGNLQLPPAASTSSDMPPQRREVHQVQRLRSLFPVHIMIVSQVCIRSLFPKLFIEGYQ